MHELVPIVSIYWPNGAAESADGRRVRRPTVLLDRDGVINVRRLDHVKAWSEFEFLPGALDALALLTHHDWQVIVLTNQANVGRGGIEWSDVAAIHDRMVAAASSHGGRIEAVIACPHRPEDGCGCRKPGPGMVLEACRRFGLSLRDALLVGDDLSDVQAAGRAGCRSILVLSGRAAPSPDAALPDGCIGVLPDLLAAAHHLVGQGVQLTESRASTAVHPDSTFA